MRIVKGDILTAQNGYILQQLNCVGDHPAGFSYILEKAYPGSCPYMSRQQPDTPGTISLFDTKKGITIINMFSQYYPGYHNTSNFDTEEMRQGWFKECLMKILNVMPRRQPTPINVLVPYKIGCCLGGGNWDAYKNMLSEFESTAMRQNVNLQITIYNNRPEGCD